MYRTTMLLFFSCGFFCVTPDAYAEAKVKYIISFSSHKSTCFLRVNDLPGADSTLANLRTVSLGINSTAFLENGSNRIELLMGPMNHLKPDTLYKDSRCTAIITKATADSSVEVARLTLRVGASGKISAAGSVNHTSPEDKRVTYEGYSEDKRDYGLYKLESEITLTGLPEWSWTKATPVTDANLSRIRGAYENIWKLMHDRDTNGLKKISAISVRELAQAEQIPEALIFSSTGLLEYVLNEKLRPLPIAWDKYKLISYRNGRLFRMAVGFFQNSPLKMIDEHGTPVYAFSPYFSIIDNKVVLVR